MPASAGSETLGTEEAPTAMCSRDDDPSTYSKPKTYTIEYPVEAETRLEAITEASAMLRSGLTLLEVIRAEPRAPGWWNVKMAVREAA